MKQLFLLALVVFGICTTVHAQKLQGQAKIDSLLAELPKAKEDTNKVYLLDELFAAYETINLDTAISYGHKAIFLAEKLGMKKMYGLLSANLGANYYYKSDYVESLKYLQKAKHYFETYDPESIYLIGNMINIANIYGDLGKTTLGLNMYLKVQELVLENRARIGEESFKSILTTLNLNIGFAYYNKKNNALAMEYYTKGLALSREIKDTANTILLLNNIGLAQRDLNDLQKALSHYEEALQLSKKVNNKIYQSTILGSIGNVYTRQHKYKKAIQTLNAALNIATETGNLSEIIKCNEYLKETYVLMGDYKNALKAKEQYIEYKDSVFNIESTEKIARLEVRAKYEKIQIADSIQNAETHKLAALRLSKQRSFTYGGIGIAVLLLAFSVFVFLNNKKLGFEKQKSEDLLHNILPQEVASDLKERGATTAQHYDKVTVLFTDFVDFTSAGERMDSQALVEELHNCFEAFDGIMDKYGIEKIKTIGDAYLAVCGLPTADEQHAEKVVKAAQEIRSFMVNRHAELGDKTFEVRVGVHSGDVVAGIVGVKKFAYDIWGDTVNTAARMEQNSEAGKINISQTTYQLVQDKFTCTYRGELEAKNKGKLKMYFVEV